MQKKFALQIPCVCRLNSRLSFYHHSHYVNELHCNTRPRISSEPCKHLVLHATFEECRRVGRATRALVAYASNPIEKHFHRLSFIFAARVITTITVSHVLSNVITINARIHANTFQNRSSAHEYFPLFSSFTRDRSKPSFCYSIVASNRVVTMLGATTPVPH